MSLRLPAWWIYISLPCIFSFSLAPSAATQSVLRKMREDTQTVCLTLLCVTWSDSWIGRRAALTAAETFNVSAHGQCANANRGSQLSAQGHSVSFLFCFTNALTWMSSCVYSCTELCGKLRGKATVYVFKRPFTLWIHNLQLYLMIFWTYIPDATTNNMTSVENQGMMSCLKTLC